MRKGFFDKPAKKAAPASSAPAPTKPAPSQPASTPSTSTPDSTSHLPIAPIKLSHSVAFPTQPVHPDIPFWSFLTPDPGRDKPHAECALHLLPSSMKAALDRSSFIKTGGKAPMPKLSSNLSERDNYEVRGDEGGSSGAGVSPPVFVRLSSLHAAHPRRSAIFRAKARAWSRFALSPKAPSS